MELVFLGTSSMVPTRERNHSAILLSHGREHVLIDCGEGTQRQLKIAGIPAPRLTRIFLSHWHGDHTLGLPGLLQTLAAAKLEHTIHIYGPAGIKERFAHMLHAFFYDERVQVEVHEVRDGVVFENDELTVAAAPLRHSIPAVGYRFAEKDRRRINLAKAKKLGLKPGPQMGKLQDGKSITHDGKKITPDDVSTVVKGKVVTFLFDTSLCKSCTTLAKDADVLVAEATYANELEAKAEEYRHMTAGQAASIASQSDVKKLVLTHFSQRYKNVDELLGQAKDVFPETVAAADFMKLKVK